MVKTIIPTGLFKRIEPIGHLIESILMAARYGFPGRKVHVIGVTGTNGKTTTSMMIHRMLHEAGIKVAILSTVATGVGDQVEARREHVTTAKSSRLQKHLRDFARQGVEWVVIETSSHSLAQHRVWGIPYEIAVLTNITEDHLDYHGTFERYVEAKRQLFVIANKHGRRCGIVNADDPSAKKFADSIAHSVSYGIESGALRATDVQLRPDGSTYTAIAEGASYQIAVGIPGKFNVSNSLAAVAVGRELNLTTEQIEGGIAATTSVEGRMKVVDEGQPFRVIVDFASTPDAFENFFQSIRPLTKGKLIAVFGSAGRRDTAKRPIQGEVAAKYADEVVLTEEDDRDEPGADILAHIAEGARAGGKILDQTLFLRPNREEAIGFAMTRASGADDVVVLLGKGHEKTIERADGEYPWDESEVARAALQALREA